MCVQLNEKGLFNKIQKSINTWRNHREELERVHERNFENSMNVPRNFQLG